MTVSVTAAGEPASLTLSEEWASRSSGAEISREINGAIADARAGSSDVLRTPLEGTPLARYQRLTDDPDALVRFLRGEE